MLEGFADPFRLHHPQRAFRDPLPQARTLDKLVFAEDFVAASPSIRLEGRDPQPGTYNYFQSSDPTKWRTGVRGYREVVYREAWPGVDVRIYAKGSDLEQEFIVQAGGDLTRVRIAYRGVDGLNVGQDQALEIATSFGKLRETKPLIYQRVAGQKVELGGRYKLLNQRSYTFEVEPHNPLYTLVIDPTVLYSTFLGGSSGNPGWVCANSCAWVVDEVANGVGVDSAGNAYVAGYTASTDFPTTTGVVQTTNTGGRTAFITKVNATGSALMYSTYLGNTTYVGAIAVDSKGNAYVTGVTGNGSAFPTTPNAYYRPCPAQNFFLTVLAPTGSSLAYSTCFNGDTVLGYNAIYGPSPKAIATDGRGRAFVAGTTGADSSLPTTPNAFQTTNPGVRTAAFAMVFDTTVSGAASLTYSTLFAIPTNDWRSGFGVQGRAIAVDSFGNMYLAGRAGDGLPTTDRTFHASAGTCPNEAGFGGSACPDAYVVKFNPSASGTQSLIYSTYLGSSGEDSGDGIAVDFSGNAYVTGYAAASDFPTTPGAFQTTGATAGFVTKLNPAGSNLIYSTYLTGTQYQVIPSAIALDLFGNAFVAGSTNSATLPVSQDAFQRSWVKVGGSTDNFSAFLTVMNTAGSGLTYSSYLGGNLYDRATGIALDSTGDAYVVGYTNSANFPVTGASFQPLTRGPGDAFVTKFPVNGTFRVLALEKNRGGNAGNVTITVFGTGFHSGVTGALIGGPQPITPSAVTVGPSGRILYLTFNLLGVLPAIYGVSVTNTEGITLTLPNSYTVEQGGAPDIRFEVSGRAGIRGGVPTFYLAGYSNRGTVDSGLVRLWISFPSYFTWSPPLDRPPASAGQLDGTTYVAFDMPSVAVGATGWIPMQLTAPNSLEYAHQAFTVQVWKEDR